MSPLLCLSGAIGLLGVGLAAQAGLLAAPHALAALLVFAVGLAFAGFLWWLAARSFALLHDPATTPAQLAALRDLPMALPEGTVRAVLALIVGVVGLPMLLFSQALALNDSVAGYVNGIIAGVFGFYFGARGQAQNTAQRRVNEAPAPEASSATLLETLRVQAHGARLLLDRLGPALPPGLLPPGAAGALAAAEAALATPMDATLRAALARLTGAEGPVPALLRAALPLLPGAMPAAAVLSLGWGLGAAAWRRFRARLLDAPHDPTLFDPGLITPGSALLCLTGAPIFARVFAPRVAEPGFMAALLDAALRDDAAERLWTGFPGFASPAEASDGLAEFRDALLDAQLAEDLPPGTTLAAPQARPAPPEAEAALQALTLWLGELREARLDPAPLLAGLRT